MNRRHTTRGGIVLAAALAVTFAIAARARGETGGFDLLIDRRPVGAGRVTPDSGTHRFSANSMVSLRADPEPGYQFAYWLGDVSDPKAERTTVVVNESKVVVAVFQAEPRKRLEEQARSGGGGGDNLMLTATDLSSPGWSSAGGGRTHTEIIPIIIDPIHTPEPATIALLSLGALLLRRRAR